MTENNAVRKAKIQSIRRRLAYGRRRSHFTIAAVVSTALSLGLGCSNKTPRELSQAGPLREFVPAGSHLMAETTLPGDRGILGQNGVPTILRRFGPEPGIELSMLLERVDAAARADALAVTIHRDGHCATKSVESGTAVFVWLDDPEKNELRLRVVFADDSTSTSSELCIAEAGPPT